MLEKIGSSSSSTLFDLLFFFFSYYELLAVAIHQNHHHHYEPEEEESFFFLFPLLAAFGMTHQSRHYYSTDYSIYPFLFWPVCELYFGRTCGPAKIAGRSGGHNFSDTRLRKKSTCSEKTRFLNLVR